MPSLCAVLLIAASGSSHPAAAPEPIAFKRQATAILKIDNKPVKFWDVFVGEKRSQLVLVQLGRRYLLLDTKEKEILELEPGAVEHKPKGNDLVWARTPESEKLLESEDWALRKIGPAVSIKVRLAAEGRVLEVQLPRVPDSGWIF